MKRGFFVDSSGSFVSCKMFLSIVLFVDLTVLTEKVFLNESDEFNGNTFCIDRFQKIGVDNRVSIVCSLCI